MKYFENWVKCNNVKNNKLKLKKNRKLFRVKIKIIRY